MFVLLLCAFLVIFFHGNYDNKVLFKLGLQEKEVTIDWTEESWKSSLEQMRFDADIVFLGDSITRGGDFQKEFSSKKIVNLGISGDSLQGMKDRVSMVTSLNPEKVFILGGINGLVNSNIDSCIETYMELIEVVKQELPECDIYIQSVLPIEKDRIKGLDNEHIVIFNEKLEELSIDEDCTYIDLYSEYEKEESLNEDYSKDGIHIKEEAYFLWFDKISRYI